MRFQVTSKLIRPNSWITQTVRQRIPNCWARNGESTSTERSVPKGCALRSPGINREGELRGQPANPGSPGKWLLKRLCVCVSICEILSKETRPIIVIQWNRFNHIWDTDHQRDHSQNVMHLLLLTRKFHQIPSTTFSYHNTQINHTPLPCCRVSKPT